MKSEPTSTSGGSKGERPQEGMDRDQAFADTASLSPNDKSADETGDFQFDPGQTTDFLTSPAMIRSDSFAFQIPGYEILKELGRGAMGVVYAARQIRADRIVALKVMLNKDHARTEEIERFNIEAQAVARLHHPNIVGVYEVGEVKGCPFFTLEFVPGGTLAKLISQNLLPHEQVAKVMLSISKAISFAHSKQIVHRDLKPANILLDESGEPKIADFGLARRMEDTSNLTHDGMIIGTPSYMAPEQASGTVSDIGPHSDIYSLGAILYELLTGRPPFKGSTVWDVIRQVRGSDPSRPSELEPSVSKDLETICLKCLQKDPAKRYLSAEALYDDLRRYINNEPITARPIGQWERLVRLCKRNPREATLVSAILGLVLAFGILASIAATRIWHDRNEIAKQRDEISIQKEHIEQQRDEISKEKSISDDRLTLYRGTVSRMVNQFPRLIEAAPIAYVTKVELNHILDNILSQSVDTSVAGSTKQWALMATKLRAGEATRMMGLAELSANEKQTLLQRAKSDFDEAVRLAKEVYDSPEPDRSKAASNLSIVMQMQLITAFELDPHSWEKLVPGFKQAEALAREALAKASPEDQLNTANMHSSLGDELFKYATFLLDIQPQTAKYQARALEYLQEALTEQQAAISLSEEKLADPLSRKAMCHRWMALLAERQGRIEAIRENYTAALAALQKAAQLEPARTDLQRNLFTYSNEYGDHLLLSSADPLEIERMYNAGLRSLNFLVTTPQTRDLERNGLAMQYYRLGLVALRKGDKAAAHEHFSHCAAVREKVFRDARSEDARMEATLPQEIDWLLAQSRVGLVDNVQNRLREIVRLAEQPNFSGNPFSQQKIYVLASSCMGCLYQSARDQANDHADSCFETAKKCLSRAIELGYRDVNYVATDPDFEWLTTSSEWPSFRERLAAPVQKKG